MKKWINIFTRWLGLVLALMLAFTCTTLADDSASAPVSVYINGQRVSYMSAYAQDNTYMLPVRSVSQLLGYLVNWDASARAVTVRKADQSVVFASDVNSYRTSDGQDISLTAAPLNKNGVTYVPSDFFSTLLKKKVSAYSPTDQFAGGINVGEPSTVNLGQAGGECLVDYGATFMISLPADKTQGNTWTNNAEDYPGFTLLSFSEKPIANTNQTLQTWLYRANAYGSFPLSFFYHYKDNPEDYTKQLDYAIDVPRTGNVSIRDAEMNMAVGDVFSISLDEPSGTGHIWTYTAAPSYGLSLVSNTTGESGGAQKRVFQFKAVHYGTYQLIFTYDTPETTQNVRIYDYTVNVAQKADKPADGAESVRVGDSYIIELTQNPASGYEWSYTVSPSPGLDLSAERNLTTDSGENRKQYTFTASQTGDYTIIFTYDNPYDADSKPVTKTYNIFVKE